MLAAASERRIRFYTHDGQLVEEIDAATLRYPSAAHRTSGDFVIVASTMPYKA